MENKESTAGTLHEEYDKQQAGKTDQEKVTDLLKYALECVYGSNHEEHIKKKTLSLLQRAQMPVITSTYKVKRMALGNIGPIREWFIDHDFNPKGICPSHLTLPDNQVNDRVNHPPHYTWLKDLCGIEVIDITRHMDFNLGNAIKYILRNGHKSEQGMTDKEKAIEDLEKAVFYLNDTIKILKQ